MVTYGRSKRVGNPSPERQRPAFSWAVVVVIGAYSAALGLGVYLYLNVVAAPAGYGAMTVAKNQRIGRIFIHTSHGCQSAQFDNSRPSEFKFAPQPCDDVPETFGSARRRQPDGLEAIHRYFRGEN